VNVDFATYIFFKKFAVEDISSSVRKDSESPGSEEISITNSNLEPASMRVILIENEVMGLPRFVLFDSLEINPMLADNVVNTVSLVGRHELGQRSLIPAERFGQSRRPR
jgi:hypothetical protein